MSRTTRRLAAAAVGVLVAVLAASAVAAHVVKQVGPYTVAIGWLREPTYVGEQNAVQVVIHDANGQPVADLTPDDLKVVVSTGSATSDPMSLVPTYDEDTGLGTPGDYEAPLIPTVLGDYTFHVTGTIHETSIDETVTSSESTFDSVVEPSGIQFPDQLPAMGDVVTRLDRVDSRAQTAEADASGAHSIATVAVALGVLGVLGLAVGSGGLLMAWRLRRSVAS
jgi:hypothetical protein